MRIVLISTSWPRAGQDHAGGFVARLASGLSERGHELVAVVPRGPGEPWRSDGVRAVEAPYAWRGGESLAYGGGILPNIRERRSRGLLVAPLLAALAATARREAATAEVVHAHWIPSALAATATGRPRITTVHESFADVLARRAPGLVRRALGEWPVLVGTRASALSVGRAAPRADLRIVPPDVPLVDPRPFAEARPQTVVFVGRLVAEKGADVLAAAWPTVREALPSARLEVVGDGPLRPALAALGDGVELLGALPAAEARRAYARGVVVAVPSRADTFQLVSAEAMAAGRAVVATPVGGAVERVLDGRTGRVVPVEDAPALATALIELLRDPQLAARMGAEAAARARRGPSWEQVLDAVELAYSDAVRRARSLR